MTADSKYTAIRTHLVLLSAPKSYLKLPDEHLKLVLKQAATYFSMDSSYHWNSPFCIWLDTYDMYVVYDQSSQRYLIKQRRENND